MRSPVYTPGDRPILTEYGGQGEPDAGASGFFVRSDAGDQPFTSYAEAYEAYDALEVPAALWQTGPRELLESKG